MFRGYYPSFFLSDDLVPLDVRLGQRNQSRNHPLDSVLSFFDLDGRRGLRIL